AVSLQPNAGSQGEFAGLLAIRAYHRDRGEAHRDLCLIPSSAHGTNAASAAMAGMRVVVVACDDDGNVSPEDLQTKLDAHGAGVGPVAVRAHLAPYLPNHPLVPDAGPATGVGAISGAPYGSAGILPISWAYVRMMGAEGLTAATEVAVLSANYVARRLAPHYPV